MGPKKPTKIALRKLALFFQGNQNVMSSQNVPAELNPPNACNIPGENDLPCLFSSI